MAATTLELCSSDTFARPFRKYIITAACMVCCFIIYLQCLVVQE